MRNNESRDILRIRGEVSNAASDNSIITGWLGVVKVARYVCGHCGFSEEWIEYAEDIEKLRRRHVPFSSPTSIPDDDDTAGVALCTNCHSALVETEGHLIAFGAKTTRKTRMNKHGNVDQNDEHIKIGAIRAHGITTYSAGATYGPRQLRVS